MRVILSAMIIIELVVNVFPELNTLLTHTHTNFKRTDNQSNEKHKCHQMDDMTKTWTKYVDTELRSEWNSNYATCVSYYCSRFDDNLNFTFDLIMYVSPPVHSVRAVWRLTRVCNVQFNFWQPQTVNIKQTWQNLWFNG